MAYPPLFRATLLIPVMIVTVETRFALFMGAPLMCAWATRRDEGGSAPQGRRLDPVTTRFARRIPDLAAPWRHPS